jgi:hypothetical protein
MLVEVGPAKRVGNRKKIYDRALRKKTLRSAMELR